ncbi:hypothetical protein C1701_08815 [Actinoalloteichus sp. AHMU CJ021]|uniref:Uncharacterized protein n=1 Tax=Actinoalloteichus caeruleus DSM 43889 TaxID=1120930 RepID=A0ABT1JJ63_ACTCY|nr:hypothetical protein [Actinoalloteichus caeruleus]AUS78452.1 hypothetical protein C1701_08815 [Actinoalloteichus sp. AHMU CJ021]MCP2332547.1 hypothetical protein [Actinoalloteichus caeruleus DSM 43889]
MSSKSSRSIALPIAFVLFAVGLLAVLGTFAGYGLGYQDQPVWLNVGTLLTPVGLAVGVVAVLFQARRTRRSAR